MHLSRLSLQWQSFSRSHFAKSPFELDGPHSTKRWQLLLQKQYLQPTSPFPLTGNSYFMCCNHAYPLAGKVPCKDRRGIVKNNLYQKLLKLHAKNFTCFLTTKDLGNFSSSMNFLGNYILKI